MNPLIPMLAMTGAPHRDEVFEFIRNMKQQCGFEQVMLYPRTGCEVAYLSEEWFQLCSYYIEAAEVCGLKLWLYDEFNWPAGQAGGRVQETNEAYRLRNLVYSVKDGKVDFSVETTRYPNILNPEAVSLFMSLTHEQYKARFGKYFGNVIVGIYTDEPSMGYGVSSGTRLPYYDELPEDYKARFGSGLYDDLTACLTASGNTQVLGRIFLLCSERMRACFSEKIGSWCRENGLILTGHLMGDETPMRNLVFSGDALAQLSSFGMPGIDEISTDCFSGSRTVEWLLPLCDAVSPGSEHGAMAEVFALGPFDMCHAKEVQMLALTALHGVDTWFLAVAHFDMRGNMLKKDYFRNYTQANPDYRAYRPLAEKAEHFAALAAKKRLSPIRVLYDMERMGEAFLTPDRSEALDQAYRELCRELHRQQTDFSLIRPGEQDGQARMLLALDKELRVTDLLSGTTFSSATEAAEEALRLTPELVRATDKNGVVAEDILIRHFADGSFCLVDIAKDPVNRTLYLAGKAVPLEARGIYESGGAVYTRLCDAQTEGAKVHVPDKNYFRFILHSGLHEMTFFCEETVEASFLLRDIHTHRFYVADSKVSSMRGEVTDGVAQGEPALYLDGQALDVSAAAQELPQGFVQFYRQTSAVRLEPGTHTVRVEHVLDDVKFLPLLLAYGDFIPSYDGNRLKKRGETKPGDYADFYGMCDYTATVRIPGVPETQDLYFSIKGELYKELYLNGENRGGSLTQQDYWKIPRRLYGQTVSMTVRYYSTLAPLFGDIKTFALLDDNGKKAHAWGDIASAHKTYLIGGEPAFYTAERE